MTARTIITPLACRGRVVELAADQKGRRRWRKQILPLGELNIDGQRLRFDKPYLLGLQKAWQSRAVDHVPLQLATARNEHNNDPELTRGLIDDVTFEEGRGLFASVTTGERGSALLEEFPEIGVSVRLIEELENAQQGRSYPWALQHVLATWDPRIAGMAPWEPSPDQATDLARAGGRVVDLSRSTYARLGRKGAPMAPTQDDITKAVQEGVGAALAKLGVAPGEPPATDPGRYADPSEDDAARLAQEFFGDLDPDTVGEGGEDDPEDVDDDEGADARELVEASARHTRELDLANERTDDALRQVYDMRAERDAETWGAERKRWIDQGIPPHAVDLARGALEGQGRNLELSNGDRYDVAGAVRGIFETLVKTGGLVDLSRSVGTAHDGSDQTGQDAEVQSLAQSLIAGL